MQHLFEEFNIRVQAAREEGSCRQYVLFRFVHTMALFTEFLEIENDHFYY